MTGFDRGMFAVGRSGVQRDLTMAALFMFQDAGTHARACVRACVCACAPPHPHRHVHTYTRCRARAQRPREERASCLVLRF